MSKWSDEELIAGILRKSAAHELALYKAYSVPMYRVCLRYANDRSEAEDMLQEGFIRVFRDIGQFRAEGAFGGWIRKIMVNTALSHIRKRKDFIVQMEDYSPFESLATKEVDPIAKIDAENLMRVLQQLPNGYRTVFNLYAIEGYTHEEIAEELNITVGTSKSQLFKARDYIKKILEKSQIYSNEAI